MGCTKQRAASIGHQFKVKTSDNLDLKEMPEKIDLCFIDANHTYEGVHEDVVWLQSRCRYLMLHDVIDSAVPGVGRQWQELKDTAGDKKYWECFQQPSWNVVPKPAKHKN